MIRRLRILAELTTALIAQDQSLTLEQGWEHVQALKGAALAMFPGKGEVFDLVYLPASPACWPNASAPISLEASRCARLKAKRRSPISRRCAATV